MALCVSFAEQELAGAVQRELTFPGQPVTGFGTIPLVLLIAKCRVDLSR